MKRFIFMLFVLAMVLPTFGQKRNQRGEKMVAMVLYQNWRGTKYSVSFDYDKKGETKRMLSGSVNSQRRNLLIKEDGRLRMGVIIDGKEVDDQTTTTIDTNSDGCISRLVMTYKEDKGFCFYETNTYEYTNDPYTGRPTLERELNTRSTSNKPVYGANRRLYVNKNGNSEARSCDENWNYRKEDYRTRRYSSNLNDTNVNLEAFFLLGEICGDTQEALARVSEWCPISCKYFPLYEINSSGQVVTRYEYIYSGDNVIQIRKIRINKDGNSKEMCRFDFVYVEEWASL